MSAQHASVLEFSGAGVRNSKVTTSRIQTHLVDLFSKQSPLDSPNLSLISKPSIKYRMLSFQLMSHLLILLIASLISSDALTTIRLIRPPIQEDFQSATQSDDEYSLDEFSSRSEESGSPTANLLTPETGQTALQKHSPVANQSLNSIRLIRPPMHEKFQSSSDNDYESLDEFSSDSSEESKSLPVPVTAPMAPQTDPPIQPPVTNQSDSRGYFQALKDKLTGAYNAVKSKVAPARYGTASLPGKVAQTEPHHNVKAAPSPTKMDWFDRVLAWTIPGTHLTLLTNLIWVISAWMQGLQPHEMAAITGFYEVEQKFLDWLEKHQDTQVESRLFSILMRLRKKQPLVFDVFLQVAFETIFEHVLLPWDKQGQLNFAPFGRGLLHYLPLALNLAKA